MDFSGLKDYFIQLSARCGLKYPKNVWLVLPYLLFVGLLTDLMVFRLFSTYGMTLLISQVAGLLGSIGIIGIAGHIIRPDIIPKYRITPSPLFVLCTVLLIILRSGLFALAYHSDWAGIMFSPILIAAFSSMVISLYVTSLISSRKHCPTSPAH